MLFEYFISFTVLCVIQVGTPTWSGRDYLLFHYSKVDKLTENYKWESVMISFIS